jgi:flagellar protein FliS
MYNDGYHSYFENEVLASDSLKLVQLLYQGALGAIEAARGHVRAGDIRERSRAITKAFSILHELTASLDHKQGGELSQRLAALYDYAERLLIAANADQVEGPLIEAQQLLNGLLEAWQASSQAEHALKGAESVEQGYQALTLAG